MFSRRPGERFNRGRIAPPGEGGLTGFHVTQDSWFWDTKLFSPRGAAPNDSVTHDYQARLVFDTAATSVTIYGVRNTFTTLDLYVNGVLYANPVMGGSAGVAGSVTVSLPGGAQTIEIQEALVDVTGVDFNAPYTVQLPSAPTERHVWYGDSITEGSAVAPMSGTYVSLLRHDGTFPAAYNLGLSGRKLFTVAGNSTLQDTLVAYLAPYVDGTTRTRLTIALMTNDYGFATAGQTPTAFAAAAAGLFTKLHAAYPSLLLTFQTAWPRTTETANGQGFTLQDYRDAATTDLSALGYVTVWAGTDISPALGDGLHPNAAGNITIASYYRAKFGIVRGTMGSQVNVPTASVAATIVGGFQPNSVTGNKLWLRGDLGVTLNATEVSGWADQSGQGNNLAQATGGNQPTFVASDAALNSQACVQFVRANSDWMNCDALGALVSGTAKPYDIWAVLTWVSGAVTKDVWCFGRSSSSTPFLDGRISTTSQVVCGKTTDAAVALTATTTQTPAAATAHIVRWSSDGTTLKIYIDGTITSVSAFVEAAGPTTLDRFTIGGFRRNGAPTNLLDGKMAEFLIYDNQLGSTDAGDITTYLKARYGIP